MRFNPWPLVVGILIGMLVARELHHARMARLRTEYGVELGAIYTLYHGHLPSWETRHAHDWSKFDFDSVRALP